MQLMGLSGVVDRIQAGASPDAELAEFVDAFEFAPSDDTRFAMLEKEPMLTKDKRLNALVGAIAEYLAKQYKLGRVPKWVSRSARCLDRPWHFSSMFVDWQREVLTDGMREYLTYSSPANSPRATSLPRSVHCDVPAARDQPRLRPA